jgi:hypothetical protein
MTDKKSTIWQEELRKHLDNATPTEDWRKSVEQDDRIIQFDAGEEVKASEEEEEEKAIHRYAVAKALEEHEKLHQQGKADWKKYNVARDYWTDDIFFRDEDEKASPNVRRALERLVESDPYVYNPDKPRTGFVKPRPREEVLMPDLDKESKRSDRFFGMRLNGKSIDDIENTFLAMFAEFVSLMALLIGALGFGVLLWAIFG